MGGHVAAAFGGAVEVFFSEHQRQPPQPVQVLVAEPLRAVAVTVKGAQDGGLLVLPPNKIEAKTKRGSAMSVIFLQVRVVITGAGGPPRFSSAASSPLLLLSASSSLLAQNAARFRILCNQCG